MARLVIFKETDRTAAEIASEIDRYLVHVKETLRPFEGGATYSWNLHRNRMTIQGNRFAAEIVLIPKGVVVTVEISAIWYPFKRRIEERLSHAIETILAEVYCREGPLGPTPGAQDYPGEGVGTIDLPLKYSGQGEAKTGEKWRGQAVLF